MLKKANKLIFLSIRHFKLKIGINYKGVPIKLKYRHARWLKIDFKDIKTFLKVEKT